MPDNMPMTFDFTPKWYVHPAKHAHKEMPHLQQLFVGSFIIEVWLMSERELATTVAEPGWAFMIRPHGTTPIGQKPWCMRAADGYESLEAAQVGGIDALKEMLHNSLGLLLTHIERYSAMNAEDPVDA